MEPTTLLPPRRGDEQKVIRCSGALYEAVKQLATDLHYPIHDVVNAGLEMVLAQYGRPIPPVK